MPGDRKSAAARMKALDDERVAMVRRHEKPFAIRAVSAAYLKADEEVYSAVRHDPGGIAKESGAGR